MNFMQRRIAQLETKVKEAAQAYYTDGTSELSDQDFDSMVAELKKLAPESEVLHKTGWGYDVIKDTTPGEKVKHKYGEAGSLSKAYSWGEVSKSLQNKVVDASLKLDGISVVLYYEKGRLVQALTRGDGIIGIDITEKAVKILKDKVMIGRGFTGAVRGELVMSYENFEIFAQSHERAENPRNSTAGLINGGMTDDIKYIDCVVYSVIGSDNHYFGKSSKYDGTTLPATRAWLQVEFGADNCAPFEFIHLCEDTLIDEMERLRSQWYGKWPADGIVLTHTDAGWDAETLEVTYDAQAFKFPSEVKSSEVIEVMWRMTKNRYYMPKVRVQPIRLAGTTVQHATGYNAQYIKENQIGVGSVVTLEKRGEIIPNINEVLTATGAVLPTRCPVCDTELEWAGVHLRCPNEACGNASTQDILMWCKKLAPVDGFGDILIKKYISELFGEDVTVNQLMDGRLWKYVPTNESDRSQVALFKKMCNLLMQGQYSLSDALEALNIPRLGTLTAKKLGAMPGAVRELLDNFLAEDYTDVPQILSAVGPATCEQIRANADKFLRLNIIASRIDWTEKEQVQVKGKVAITGKLSVKRDDFIQELNNAGYTVGEIGKDTNFLITDSPDSGSSKNLKADKFGIVKITEAEFRQNYM